MVGGGLDGQRGRSGGVVVDGDDGVQHPGVGRLPAVRGEVGRRRGRRRLLAGKRRRHRRRPAPAPAPGVRGRRRVLAGNGHRDRQCDRCKTIISIKQFKCLSGGNEQFL